MEAKIDYTVTTSKDFDEAVAAVEAKTREKGFKVMSIWVNFQLK